MIIKTIVAGSFALAASFGAATITTDHTHAASVIGTDVRVYTADGTLSPDSMYIGD